MPLKTSYFNKGVFKNNIKRYWLILFSYTFFLGLNVTSFLYSGILEMNRIKDLELLSDVGSNILNTGPSILFSIIYPLITALAVFAYMHYPKNTAMIHSLPLTRSNLFVTNYLSGLFIVTVPLLLNGILLVGVEAIAGFPTLYYAFVWVGLNLVVAFLLYTFAVFAGMFTGHMAAQAIFFYIFNFIAVFLESVFASIFGNFLFGYVSPSTSTNFEVFSPILYQNSFYRGFQNYKGDIGALIGYVIAGLIFLALSYYLYKKRHMEVATDVISFSFIKPIFKYSVAFCSAALIGSIILMIFDLNYSLFAYIIAYLVGGFIGYFSAEMLVRKNFRVFGAYKGFIAFSIVLSLFLISVDFDFYGYERRVPKESEIEMVALKKYQDSGIAILMKPEAYDPYRDKYYIQNLDYSTKDYNNEKTIDIEGLKVIRDSMPEISEDEEVIAKVRQIHSHIVENKNLYARNEGINVSAIDEYQDYVFNYRRLYFIYRLEDGSLIEREYDLRINRNDSELDNLLREYLSLPGIREAYEPILTREARDVERIYINYESRYADLQEYEITENIQDLLDVLKKDILAKDPLNSMFNDFEQTKYDSLFLRIEYRKPPYSSDYYSIDDGFENTLKYINELVLN